MTLMYIHGQYGSPEEAEHYRPLLPGCEVIGFDYKAQMPWEAEREFAEYFDCLVKCGCGSIGIIANSIGAFYSMCALAGRDIGAAFFISPIVDLECIEGVTLDEEHLRYVRQHPIDWRMPTHILYGENDNLTSLATISDFAHRTGATLEVMPGGEQVPHPGANGIPGRVDSKGILQQSISCEEDGQKIEIQIRDLTEIHGVCNICMHRKPYRRHTQSDARRQTISTSSTLQGR